MYLIDELHKGFPCFYSWSCIPIMCLLKPFSPQFLSLCLFFFLFSPFCMYQCNTGYKSVWRILTMNFEEI